MEDRSYFLNRAEMQVELARKAVHEKAAQAHYELAGYYWDRAFNPQMARPQRVSTWARLLDRLERGPETNLASSPGSVLPHG
ncbi:MAG: hypothetical protein JWL74_1820 [Alphaproteobacteria bacterium]|jgi:hypothetical protein|nr:hypothetical protein [Alphaproteobacteria bacterium]